MPRFPFSETLAHPDDPLPHHLERVAQRAADCVQAAIHEVKAAAFLAGLFHDIGKATPFFQDYLQGRARKSELTAHAKSGAALSWWCTSALDFPLWLRLAVFIAVLRHHGALRFDGWHRELLRVREDVRDRGSVLRRQIESMDLDGIREWLDSFLHRYQQFGMCFHLPELDSEAVISSLHKPGQSKLRRSFGDIHKSVAFLASFGALLSVDKVDAALQGEMIARNILPADMVDTYKSLKFQSGSISALDMCRRQIASEVEYTWQAHPDAQLMTLTAPTGSGKTLTILNAALKARQTIHHRDDYLPRIIYCLPFTSVIDQNYAVFRDVLTSSNIEVYEDVLLKHHHLVGGLYRTANTEFLPDGAGQLLTETWQSEIVVTTFHQLLKSMLSQANAELKRAGQLTGGIVLMDEVQAVPLCYWQALRHLFQACADSLGTRFVLLTATRPLIFRPVDALELLPTHKSHFEAMSRVCLYCHHHENLTMRQFAQRILNLHRQDQGSFMVILNRRKAVKEMFGLIRNMFPDRKLVALSTDLTPLHRRSRIRLIQRLLRQDEPLIVVSTQLVEAGVDISFPVVHRDLAPLDSIVQAAGRCNRNAAATMGEVHLWQICTEKVDGSCGTPMWRRVYDLPLMEVTRDVLSAQSEWRERDFLELSEKYFEGCYQRRDQDAVDEWLGEGDFDRVGRDFQLIKDGAPKTSLFVFFNDKDRRLWQRYEDLQTNESLSPSDKHRAFRIFRHAFYERLIQVYGNQGSDESILPLEAGAKTYNRSTGFVALPEEQAACII